MKGQGVVIGIFIDEIDPDLMPAKEMRKKGINRDLVDEYAQRLDELDPIQVMIDSRNHHWLVDGAHTVSAARKAGKQEVRAKVTRGEWLEAWEAASYANAARGARLEPHDMKHRVEAFLRKPESNGLTQTEIAKICNVAQQYVSQIKSHYYNSSNSGSEYETSNKDRVADFYKANPQAKAREVADALGVSKGTVDKYRAELGLSTPRGANGGGNETSEATDSTSPPEQTRPPEPMNATPTTTPTQDVSPPESNPESPSALAINTAPSSPSVTANADALRGDPSKVNGFTFDFEDEWERFEKETTAKFQSIPSMYQRYFITGLQRLTESLKKLEASTNQMEIIDVEGI